MENENPITKAIEIVGLQPLATICGVTYQAVKKWEVNGLPLSELVGKTTYSDQIQTATSGKVSSAMLKEWLLDTQKDNVSKKR